MAKERLVLCDTNIIIEFYKENDSVLRKLQAIGQESIAVSIITVGELLFGALNKKERRKINQDIAHLHLLHMDSAIGDCGSPCSLCPRCLNLNYEDMDFAKGDLNQAYELAKKHLAQLREVADVKTICMHGSPLSKYDNRSLWNHYDYRDYGIIAEPYFDLDFSKVLYLTDTGRRWDGEEVSIRDKAPVRE